MIGALNSNISIMTVPKTDIVRITCSTSDRQLSADIVNKLIIDYIHRSFQSRYDATQRASDFLTAQLHDLKQQVEDSQARLIDLGKRVGIIGLDSSRNQINNTLDALSKAAGEAQIDRIFAESRYRALAGMDPASVDPSISQRTGSPSSTLDNLRGSREALLATLAQLTADKNLGPRHPRVLALKAQIAELDRQIAEEQRHVLIKAKQQLTAAHINEDQTHSALEEEKASAYKLRDDLIDYSLRQREFESNRALYENLLERLRTAGIQAGLESTEIDIVDSATPPSGPTLQPRSTILLVDTLVMFVVGLIVAFIIDSLDAGIQTIAELERVLGLPSLALIPRARRAADQANLTVAQRNIGVISGPKSQFAEAFRALRTSLLLSAAGSEPKVILLTSATPSEGKTTAAVNLACVLAQRNVRVLLIDADLRRPTVHHRFGVNGKVGLTSVLAGSISLQDAVQNFAEIPTLDLLVSGPVPPFPTEMLGSAAMHKLLAQARGIYTHIVLDSPPLLSVTDSVVLARETDAVVLIVRHGKSNKHAIRRGRDILARAGARITGIALNAVDLNSPEYNAYYGYYGYGGYSGYASAGVDSTAWETQSDANTPAKPGSSHQGDAR
jgi:capsular exopolysaccharide synthesis family protein